MQVKISRFQSKTTVKIQLPPEFALALFFCLAVKLGMECLRCLYTQHWQLKSPDLSDNLRGNGQFSAQASGYSLFHFLGGISAAEQVEQLGQCRFAGHIVPADHTRLF
jgi:hypothetical protein